MIIKSNFIGSFNLGDNLAHNFKILNYLYGIYQGESSANKALLRKPLILLIASICEGLLDDFFFKVKHFTREGVGDLPEEVLEEIRTKKISKFHFYIEKAEEFDLFKQKETNFYEALHHIKRLRNRIHIQDTPKDLPIKERESFTPRDLGKCERVLEGILKIMDHKFSRGKTGYVEDFEYPWPCHWQIKDLIR